MVVRAGANAAHKLTFAVADLTSDDDWSEAAEAATLCFMS
jgi:hypothetical protein